MTQQNLSDEDRSQPRYQAPPVTGAAGPNPKGVGNTQPFISPATGPSPATPDPSRPADWPSPDPAPPYQAPGPGYGAYSAPPPSSAYDWNKAASSDNLYRYENYGTNSAPYAASQPPDPQAEAYRQASRRVRARLDFQKNLRAYLLVNGLLWVIYFLTMNPAHPSFWPIWSTVFWGIGLLAQWWNLSGRQEDRQRHMIEEEMRRRNRY